MTPSQILALLVTANTILTVPAVPNDIGLPQIYNYISYQLDLHLDHKLFSVNGTQFLGKVQIRFSVTNETDYIALHSSSNLINLYKITFDNDLINTYFLNRLTDILKIPLKEPITVGVSHELIIEYNGNINTEDPEAGTGLYKSSYVNKDGITKYLLVTQFASTYARTVFPCFDEPAMKAVFNVSITLPSDLNVIFNTGELSRFRNEIFGLTTVQFKATPKMSTYLLAFVVSDFTCTAKNIKDTVSLRICSRYEFEEKRNFALLMTPKLLKEYNTFTNFNYSRGIEKLDIVAIPDFNKIEDSLMVMSRKTELLSEVMVAVPYFHPGVTENWGLIIHKENELLSDDTQYSNENAAVALGISHDLAHQWFGNLITVNWWSQIFVNRGLAAFFETFITNEVMMWVEKLFIVNNIYETLVYDAFGDLEPLYYDDKIHPEHIEGSYSEVSYHKGGIIMRMVQYFMDLDNFRKGIQNYVKKHKFGNVEINDLWNALEECIVDSVSHMPAKLSTVMENWIKYRGYPVLNVTYSNGHVIVSQSKFSYHHDNLVKDQTKWYVPISYTIAKQYNSYQKTTPFTWLTPNEDYISFPILGNRQSNWVILNNYQTGYYRVYYDENLMERINKALEESHFENIPEINRANLVDDLFNFARANLMEYKDVFKYINFLKYDRSYYPWKAAMDGFGLMLRRYGYTSPLGKRIAALIMELMENHFHEPISVVNKNNRIFKLKQQLVYDWACRLGDEGCIEESVELFQKFKYNGIRPAAHRRYVIYCNVLRYNEDISDWKFLLDLYRQSEGKEREDIRSALGCSRDPTLLRDYLELSLTKGSGFRFVDVMMVFIKTENNVEAIKVAFEFLIEFQEYIIENYRSTALLEYIFVGIGERLALPELQYLKDLIEKSHLTSEFRDYGAKALRAANETEVWVDKHHDELWSFFREHHHISFWVMTWTTGLIGGGIIVFLCIACAYNRVYMQNLILILSQSFRRRNRRPVNEMEMVRRH